MSARVLVLLGLAAIQNNSDLSQGLAAGSAVGRGAANRRLDRRRGGRAMPTFEDYRRMADRAAQLAIACSAPALLERYSLLRWSTWRSPIGSVSRRLLKSSNCKKCSKIPPASETSFTGRQAVTSFRNVRLRRIVGKAACCSGSQRASVGRSDRADGARTR